MSASNQHNRIIVRGKDFRKNFGIPDSTRADWENPKSSRFDPTFPKKIKLGSRSVGYFYDEVIAWLSSRSAQ
jgi:prophage regulatory protein